MYNETYPRLDPQSENHPDLNQILKTLQNATPAMDSEKNEFPHSPYIDLGITRQNPNRRVLEKQLFSLEADVRHPDK